MEITLKLRLVFDDPLGVEKFGGIFMNRLSILTRMRRGLRDRKGQSTTEYILILAIVVMLASKMKGSIGNLLEGKIQKIESDINSF